MENIKLKLASGKIVTLEAFHMCKTYSGLITGEPTEEINIEIINNISYPKNWGTRKSFIKKSTMFLSKDILNPVVFSVWLSANPVNDRKNQFDGSSVILTWLADNLKGKNIEEIIVSGIITFDWESQAENFLL